jgi:hypothetical protein
MPAFQPRRVTSVTVHRAVLVERPSDHDDKVADAAIGWVFRVIREPPLRGRSMGFATRTAETSTEELLAGMLAALAGVPNGK